MKMIKGAHFKLSSKLKEEYEVCDNCIIANISADKIDKVFREFIDMQNEPLFIIIEVPTNQNDEDETSNITHKDVYYADGLDKETIHNIFDKYGYLFINDGLSQIGVGNHITKAEIITEKYNVMRIYEGKEELNKYEALITKNNIKKTNKLKVAWDYFDDNNPGISSCITEKGLKTYDVVDILKEDIGLYYAERRED